VGQNGYSLRMDGLDRGFNDRARERALVIHGAPYVNESLAKSQGRIGRSWGCPAVREVVARDLSTGSAAADSCSRTTQIRSFSPNRNS
jgi:hypothetical protein